MAEPFEYTPCPLQFYEFKPLDHKKNCLTYESALHKSVGGDDLDKLHADLSLLRDNVQNRIQLLTSEMNILSEWQVKRDYNKRKHTDDSQQSSRSAKSHQHDTGTADSIGLAPPPSKRTKMDAHMTNTTSGGSMSSKSSKKAMRGKSKVPGPPSSSEPPAMATVPIEVEQQQQQPIMDSSTLMKVKPDTTDKFWSNVEPYCADITEEDLKMLQEFGSAHDQSLFEVPPLGPHYSRQWGVQDLMEESTADRHQEHMMSSTKLEAEGLLLDGMAAAQNSKTNGGSLGPLTQRLMAAFLEDPAGSNNMAPPIPKPNPTLPPVSPSEFETKLKEELVSLGLFEPNEQQKDLNNDNEDEVLRELEKAQAELKKVIEYNKLQKKMLHSLARAEMRRQDIRRKLQDTDTELMDILRRFASFRQRKKRESISRKDRESAEKILEARQRLVSQLLV